MSKTNVMLDLETLGLRPGCMILSIGAVKFDPDTKTLGDEFHQAIDMESSGQLGFGMDISTVKWWLTKSEAAKGAAFNEGLPAHTVLSKFACFCLGVSDVEGVNLTQAQYEEMSDNVLMWGNGAAFDNVILSAYYSRCKIVQPWKFYNDRCYRTVKAAYPDITLTRLGTHHNALDDAKSQAVHLMDIVAATGYGKYRRDER